MKVLIADDHRLIVEGVKAKLSELGDHISFVVATDMEEFGQVVHPDAGLDLAIIDITMPGTQGHQHIAQMRTLAPDVPVIVLSGSEDLEQIRVLLDLGVQGFIPKAYSPDVMLSAVRLVLAGGVYVPAMLLAGLRARGMISGDVGTAAAPRDAGPVDPAHALDGLRQILTARQIEVMLLLSQGKPNKLIARDLGISEGTVKIHLAAIFRALNVRNRVEAVVASRTLTER